jgi:hypothetical protein
VTSNQKYSGQASVKVFLLKAPKHLHGIFQAGLNVSVCLEELLPPECWSHAQKQGWLTKRRNLVDLNPSLVADYETSVKAALTKKKLPAEAMLYLENEVAKNHKESFSKYISRLDEKSAARLLDGLKQTIADITNHLALVT